MPSTVIEKAAGSVNGTNQQFKTSAAYLPGSLQVWVNGLLKRKGSSEGWTELGINKFQLNIAPVAGSVVQVYFRPL